MLAAVNRVYTHGGRQYHLQAEDLGPEQACFEARVYESGAVLWRKRVPYTDLLARKLPKMDEEEGVRTLMDKTLQTVQAAIAKGKLGG